MQLLDFAVAQIHYTKLIWTRAIPSDENNSLGWRSFIIFDLFNDKFNRELETKSITLNDGLYVGGIIDANHRIEFQVVYYWTG